MSELKPCPFCGGEAKLDFAHDSHYYITEDGHRYATGFHYTVRCKDIFCGCKIGAYEKPEMAIEAWNRREGEQQ